MPLHFHSTPKPHYISPPSLTPPPSSKTSFTTPTMTNITQHLHPYTPIFTTPHRLEYLHHHHHHPLLVSLSEVWLSAKPSFPAPWSRLDQGGGVLWYHTPVIGMHSLVSLFEKGNHLPGLPLFWCCPRLPRNVEEPHTQSFQHFGPDLIKS